MADFSDTDWLSELRHAFRDAGALLAHLHLTPAQVELLPDTPFPLLVPRYYADLMQRGDPHDPLLRQVLPVVAEQQPSGWATAPLEEQARMVAPGLVQKYEGRVLWMLTGVCPVHCRYCFRRHYDYAAMSPSLAHIQAPLTWLREHEDVHEVILSGGDPLSLRDAQLDTVMAALATMHHVRSVRFHTRMPIVLPARVTPTLLALCRRLTAAGMRVVMVLHANCRQEVQSEPLHTAVAALRAAGVHLYAQSVLLRRVNDCLPALVALCTSLIDAGVQPYYLHLLDPVRGAQHFDVPEQAARHLYGELVATMPGYMVPKLVRETNGAAAKTQILPLPAYVAEASRAPSARSRGTTAISE